MSTLSDVLQFVGLLGGDPAEMQAAKDRREAEMKLAKSLSSPKYFAETIRQGLLSPEVPMPPERPQSLLSEVPLPPRRGLDIDAFKRALVKTETGSFDNPFIFTTVPDRVEDKQVSSAFGPAQITYTLAEEVLKNQDKDADPGYVDYLNSFIQQGKDKVNAAYRKKNMSQGYTETIQPGGLGVVPMEQHNKYYDRLFNDALRRKGAFKPEATLEGVARNWYASPSEKANQAYIKKVRGNY